MIYDFLEGHDLVPDRQYLLAWKFRMGDLACEDRELPLRPVYRALLRGLRTLPLSGDGRVWARRFGVWAGWRGECFRVGIPARMCTMVPEMLGRFFEPVPGYDTIELCLVPDIQLVPVFCYNYGRICEYGPADMVGKVYRDGVFGSGVLLEGRGLMREGRFQ